LVEPLAARRRSLDGRVKGCAGGRARRRWMKSARGELQRERKKDEACVCDAGSPVVALRSTGQYAVGIISPGHPAATSVPPTPSPAISHVDTARKSYRPRSDGAATAAPMCSSYTGAAAIAG